MPLRRLVGFLLMAVVSSAVAAQDASEHDYTLRVEVVDAAPKKDKWAEVHSEHFLIAGNAGEKELRRIAVDLEELRRLFYRVFPNPKPHYAAFTTVLVFRNGKAFRPFEGHPPGRKGYVLASRDRDYIAINADEKDRRRVYHEYVHTLMRDAPLPLWLREGLAEYYGGFKQERYLVGDYRTVVVGFPIHSHERLLRDPALLPLAQLFTIGEDSAEYDEDNRNTVFYAQSWALVHLLHTPRALPSFKHLLELLVSGEPAEESFRQAFRIDPSDLDLSLRGYVRDSKSNGWAYTRTTYCMCRSGPLDWLQFNFDRLQTDVKERELNALSEAGIRFHFGDLMLHRGDLARAEMYLESAVRLDPSLARAHASLGALRTLQEQYDAAFEHLQRALELDPQSPFAHFYHASLIRQSAVEMPGGLSRARLEAMRSSLVQAVQAAPRFAAASEMLADVNRRIAADDSRPDPSPVIAANGASADRDSD